MSAKAQITLEFLIYLAVGISALAVSIYATAGIRSGYTDGISEYALESFFSHISSMQQYESSSFAAYVPKSICSCLGSERVVCGNYTAYSGARIKLGKSICKYSGSVENISESYSGMGLYSISGSP
jgi:hypothetical protein